ncbi:hypothetical protein P5704_028280 (plasmid) [Pseudomonas sp. FeN3W]|nr:hypothetical protein P5704_028280 [Pseudomonas sp. FeN3W]
MSNLTAKNRASNLKRAIQDILGTPIKLSQAYEILAREEGYQNWDTASALLLKEQPPTNNEQSTYATLARDGGNHTIGAGHRSDTNKTTVLGDPLPGLISFSVNHETDRPHQVRRFLSELGGDTSRLRIACVNPSEPDRWFSNDSKYVDLSPSNLGANSSSIDIMGVIGRRLIDVAIFDELKSEQMIAAARGLFATGYIVIVMIKLKDAEFGLVYSNEYNMGDGDDLLFINKANSKRNSVIGRYGKINDPLNTCTSKQICLIVSSLLPPVDLWSSRSCLLLEAVLDVLCYLRDTSSFLCDAKSVMKHLSLDEVVNISHLEAAPEHIKDKLCKYLNELPYFNHNDIKSLALDQRCYQHHGYLTMSLKTILSSPGIEIIMAIKMLRMMNKKAL